MTSRQRVDARGRVRIPKDLRERLGFVKGTTIQWVQEGEVLRFRKLDSGDVDADTAGAGEA
jgi:bifunctional DNA-binding transcriptional regulator/antitoxin component of YhaV-PrlF toxin-antitoxin module